MRTHGELVQIRKDWWNLTAKEFDRKYGTITTREEIGFLKGIHYALSQAFECYNTEEFEAWEQKGNFKPKSSLSGKKEP